VYNGTLAQRNRAFPKKTALKSLVSTWLSSFTIAVCLIRRQGMVKKPRSQEVKEYEKSEVHKK
jgi:hypothetical protein